MRMGQAWRRASIDTCRQGWRKQSQGNDTSQEASQNSTTSLQHDVNPTPIRPLLQIVVATRPAHTRQHAKVFVLVQCLLCNNAINMYVLIY